METQIKYDCTLKYPILLLHGMGYRDSKVFSYWGRIPGVLRKHGAEVYFGHQDANADIEKNSQMIAERIRKLTSMTGVPKVNIIAHSKGGLEARYLVSTLGMKDHIASVTTVNTPHNGSYTIDRILRLPRVIIRFISICTDLWMRITGDRHCDTYKALHQLSTAYAKQFNVNNPDCSDVFYQSFGFKMKSISSDLVMSFPYLVVHHFDGDNDGLLSERSVRWTNFHGMYTSPERRGISHVDQVDMRRKKFSSKPPSGDLEVSDITDFYLKIADDLRKRGL
ncbi:MAG: alpha/beta hydrolase [Oscillospiraceae bacterium]|nr:alpha/beta hydrolase [Oscillospiraceae bacterium]